MEMKKNAMFAAALLLGCNAASAAIVHCHGCSESQREQAALAEGPGFHYVVDYPNTAIRKFDVHCTHSSDPMSGAEPDPPMGRGSDSGTPGDTRKPLAGLSGCPGAIQHLPLPVEAWAHEAFDLLVEFWRETNGTMQKTVVIPSTGIPGGDSAFDLTSDWPRMATMLAYMAANVSGVSLLEFTQRAFLAVTSSVPLSIRYTIQFPDGTQLDVHCTYESESCEYVQGSARDRYDQPIFDGPNPPSGGEFRLVDQAEQWLHNAWIHGITVVDMGGIVPTRVRCRYLPSGRYECTGF